MMDHNEVVREKMTERYLLDELDPDTRDQFEEHFFDCLECAFDVRAGSQFVSQSKAVLREGAEPKHAPAPHPEPVRMNWLSWLRPQLAIPAFALLLIVVGYQNLVTIPQLARSGRSAQLLPATTVNLLTYGSGSALVIHRGQSFLINVIVPPGPRYTRYKVDLYNPAGKVAESLPIAPSAGDTWPIRFPGGNWDNGLYKLTVHGQDASGQDNQVGSASFELKVSE